MAIRINQDSCFLYKFSRKGAKGMVSLIQNGAGLKKDMMEAARPAEVMRRMDGADINPTFKEQVQQ